MSLMNEGDEMLHAGKYSEAAELFRKVIQANPTSKIAVTSLYKLGYTYETHLKDYDNAIFSFEEFVKLSRDEMKLYEVQKRMANIYFEMGRDPEKAIVFYKRLQEMSPESLEFDLFQLRIGLGHFQQNKFDQARIEFEQLLAKHPMTQYAPRARFEIGNAYYMEGKYENGIDALKLVIREHPQSPYALEAEFVMAQCYEQAGKLQASLQTYENLKGRYSHAGVLEHRVLQLRKRMKKEK